MKLPISVVILTYNEELNIDSCLKSVADFVDEIFVVDSFSTDRTLERVKKYNAKILQHPFENYAKQLNWALDNCQAKGEWILRLDADEYLTEELKDELARILPETPKEVSGFLFRRRVYFLGRWIKHGGYYSTWLLRLFRNGHGRCEDRNMDEHIILSQGLAVPVKGDMVNDDRKSLTWWTAKHNNYSGREAQDVAKRESKGTLLTGRPARMRWLKLNFYYRLPLFWRAWFYFCYRYFLRAGFLDGKEGLIFHFLQGFWYRFLVDAKLYESNKIFD